MLTARYGFDMIDVLTYANHPREHRRLRQANNAEWQMGGVVWVPDSDYQELCNDVMELLINVGLMNTVIDTMPPHVREGWDQKIEMMRSFAHQQTLEVQQFGEAFDTEDQE